MSSVEEWLVMNSQMWDRARRAIFASKSPLLLSSAVHVFGVNAFALFYSLNLGPERRAYLSVAFAITVGTQSLIIYGAGLRLRNTSVTNPIAAENLARLLKLAGYSSFSFFVLLMSFHLFRIAFPIPLLVVSFVYFLSALTLFVIYEILFHLRRYRLIFFSELLIAPLIISSFFIFANVLEFSIAVSVLLSYSFAFSLIGTSCFFSIAAQLPLSQLRNEQSKELKNPLRFELTNKYFQISLFNTTLERLDKLILAFIIDPVLFSKFTLSISPIIMFRFAVNGIAKIIIAKRSVLSSRIWPAITILFSYSIFGTIVCLLVNQISLRFSEGVWNIGLSVLFVFLFYEGLRVIYLFILSSDVANSNYAPHLRLARVGVFGVPTVLVIASVLFDDNLMLAYLLLSLFLVVSIVFSKTGNLLKTRGNLSHEDRVNNVE